MRCMYFLSSRARHVLGCSYHSLLALPYLVGVFQGKFRVFFVRFLSGRYPYTLLRCIVERFLDTCWYDTYVHCSPLS